MIKITLPDGSVREYNEGVTAYDVAASISQGLAKAVVAAEVNGEVWDLTRPINADSSLKLLKFEDEGGKKTFWHSSAHLMAEAIEALHPGVKFWVGPPLDNGYYYDIDLGGQSFGEEDLQKVEKLMLELAAKDNKYERSEMPKAEAIKYFTEKGDEYKLDLLGGLKDGEITFYKQGNFTDLCRGPHIPSTGYIKAIKLLNIAGTYWKGDSNNKQLTRVYGITFPKQKQLDDYLAMLEEQKKRDHRLIGKELEIFAFDDEVGPGLPLWLPKGGALIEKLEALAKKNENEQGYVRVKSPHIAKEALYLRSGHLPYYADSMFPPMELDGGKYYLKAMNCPHHHKIFSATPKSYRDMPLRFAEYGTCYRYEQSGELMGLMRVRSMQMNDAHIYCTKDQFEEEFMKVNELYVKYFKIFGIDKYQMRFSKHAPEKLGQKYIDNAALWNETEDMVRRVLVKSGLPFVEVADEAAFYGPKIDIQIWSAIGKEFTIATNQVDFAQAERFDLFFTNDKNEKERPIIIHRAPLSTHERMIGFLLEHYAGKFPVWLAPEQVAVLPISDKYLDYAYAVKAELKKHGIEVSVDERAEKIGKKIRDTELKRVPYMLVVGEKEAADNAVAVRKQGHGDQGTKSLADFVAQINQEIAEYK
ncbi:MAG TPA: threonine--tRNA ligase [Chitinophagales bacterium]|nr:threonine--tRNA ligase [Chitinophagales bacterium]